MEEEAVHSSRDVLAFHSSTEKKSISHANVYTVYEFLVLKCVVLSQLPYAGFHLRGLALKRSRVAIEKSHKNSALQQLAIDIVFFLLSAFHHVC